MLCHGPNLQICMWSCCCSEPAGSSYRPRLLHFFFFYQKEDTSAPPHSKKGSLTGGAAAVLPVFLQVRGGNRRTQRQPNEHSAACWELSATKSIFIFTSALELNSCRGCFKCLRCNTAPVNCTGFVFPHMSMRSVYRWTGRRERRGGGGQGWAQTQCCGHCVRFRYRETNTWV